MATAPVIDFNAPDLACCIKQHSQSELDRLLIGVILLDPKGTVLFYSETEARQSGSGKLPLVQNFFAGATCMDNDDFHGRVARAQEAGPVNLEFGWSGDFADRKRDLRIRVQSARQGSVCIMIDRDPTASASAATARLSIAIVRCAILARVPARNHRAS